MWCLLDLCDDIYRIMSSRDVAFSEQNGAIGSIRQVLYRLPTEQSSEIETTFHHYYWRLKSRFKLVWMESTFPCNTLIGYSLKWRAAAHWSDPNLFCQKHLLTFE
jgi:hypothetical protein